jgi:stalled ribosome alternative rescue factor ArfA
LAVRLAITLMVLAAAPALADREGREFKEKFRDGPCRVEREGKSDGSYKEQRECRYRPGAPEFEEKFEDGACRIEREQKADGTYKEKIDCAP